MAMILGLPSRACTHCIRPIPSGKNAGPGNPPIAGRRSVLDGGSFTTNCYLAFKKEASDLNIGASRFKGAALAAWMEFRKQHRSDFYSKAVRIDGFTEGKKGRIVFRIPKLAMTDISPETIATAIELDKTLQEFLKGYFSRNKKDQTEAVASSPEYQESGGVNHQSHDMEHIPPADIPYDEVPF
jgi:hypothetical protein